MHKNNPFQNIKDYWGSYYKNISEGWNDAIEDATGFIWIDKGHDKYDAKYDPDGHGHHFYNEETDEKMSQDEVMKLYDSKKEHPKSEEVEYDGDQLDELSDAKMRGYVMKSAYNAAVDAPTNQVKKRLKGIGTALKSMAGYRSNTNKTETIKKEKVEHLFHKDSDRLLREHIRAEYEARGIYPTSREVQETYNMVMDLIEKRKSYEQRTASLMLRRGASGKQVKDTVGQKRTPEGKSGNAILRKAREDAELQGIMQNHFTDDNDEPIVPRIQDHLARRGKKTKISPSSPARKQSEVEVDTRFLMGQGFSPSHLRRIMTDSGR